MKLLGLLLNKNISEYSLSKISGVPYSTISDICSGKTNIKKCNVETVYKLAKALNLSVEELIEENTAEFDESSIPYTKFDYYKKHMKFRKNAILAYDSALEYLDYTDSNFSKMIKVYSTVLLPYPFMVKKVKNFNNIEYMSVGGVLVTTLNQTIDDCLSDKETDYQILDQALNNYYYKNNKSFEGIVVSKKNQLKFNKEKEIALSYYDN